MERVSKDYFKSVHKDELSYYTYASQPSYYLLPLSVLLLGIFAGLGANTFVQSGMNYAIKLVIMLVLLPILFIGLMMMTKFVVALIKRKDINLAIYKDTIFIKDKDKYLLIEREHLKDFELKKRSIKTQEMEMRNVSALDANDDVIELITTQGSFYASTNEAEKACQALQSFKDNESVEKNLEQFHTTVANNITKGIIKLATAFGTLCALHISLFLILSALKASQDIINVVAATFGTTIFLFAVVSILYAFIAPQLKESKRQTIKAKQNIGSISTENNDITHKIDEQDAAQSLLNAKTITSLCKKNIKGSLPFFIICLAAFVALAVALFYGVTDVIIMAVFIFPLTIFIAIYYALNIARIISAKIAASSNNFCIAKVVDFKLGAAGYGRMTLSFQDDRNQRVQRRTGYVYANNAVKLAAENGNVKIRYSGKNIIVLI